MSLATATDAVRQRVATASGFDHRVKFDFGDDGQIHVDGTAGEVGNEDKDADCTITMSLENFQLMIAGEMDPVTAFMMGRLKVSGDMGVAMKLSSVI